MYFSEPPEYTFPGPVACTVASMTDHVIVIGPAYVTTTALLSTALKKSPRSKWDLLGRALLVTYGPDPVDDGEDDGDA